MGADGAPKGAASASDQAVESASDRLLARLSVVPVVAAFIWYGLNASGHWGPAAAGWLPAGAALALAAVATYRTATAPLVALAARRFWWQISLAAGLCTCAMLVRVINTAVHPDATAAAPVPSVLLSAAGVLVTVRALVRIPGAPRSRRQRIRLLLDLTTVGLGAALIMWYATLGPLLLRPGGASAASWGALLVGAVCVTGVTTIAKIILAGAAPVDLRSLLLLGAGLLAGAVSAGMVSVVIERAQVVPGQLVIPFIAATVVYAARRQRLAAAEPTSAAPEPTSAAPGLAVPSSVARRPGPPSGSLRWWGMLLPYGAVVATDVLLVLAVKDHADLRSGVVVGGVLAVTAVVGARQFMSLRDNVRLVRELRGQEARLRHQAAHDALTDLANRTLFAERLDAALASGPISRIAVLLIDLDDFKSVNDTLGHAVGDTLLRAVADRLRHCIRASDTVARLGGDEFGVLLHGVDPEVADATANRILGSLASPVVAGDHRLLIRASIGIAIAAPGDDSGMALRNADIAMYAAKERGKGNRARYLPGMATNVAEHARLGAELGEALAGAELHPLYQPITLLAQGRVVGVETLIRWRHPTRGLMTPEEFIVTAERTGLIVPIGRWVLREACRQLAAWRRDFGAAAPASIAVNVSGRQLAERDFPAEVAAAAGDAGLAPHELVLEMTEDAVLTGDHAIDVLHELDRMGFRLALDDFGTGQSSLGLLRTCPVRILKLDRSFVDGIAEGTQQAAIATAVVRMAQSLGLDAVAEGIEQERQAEFLMELGYRLGQGFHLGRPLPAAEVAALFGPGPATPDPGPVALDLEPVAPAWNDAIR